MAKGRPTEGWPCILGRYLPQLRLPQREGISQSGVYRTAVLRGVFADLPSPDVAYPVDIDLFIAGHWAGSIPVLSTPHMEDFEWLLHALAFRCEPVLIPKGIHAQAVNGLIHWGLIKNIGRDARAQMILLHESPYGSVPASRVPGTPGDEEWLRLSQIIRLEHELTHMATKRLLGETRINLLDELIADAMGMLKALGLFSADLFRECMGISSDGTADPDSRAGTYIAGLSTEDGKKAIRLCLERANELEEILKDQSMYANPIQLLHWLSTQRLDYPLTVR